MVLPRIARIVAPGLPHHVTQRGNRRMQTFFRDEDYQEYLTLLPTGAGCTATASGPTASCRTTCI